MPKSWKRLRLSAGDEQGALVATRLVASSGPRASNTGLIDRISD